MNVLDFRKYTIKTTEKHKDADNRTGRQTDRQTHKHSQEAAGCSRATFSRHLVVLVGTAAFAHYDDKTIKKMLPPPPLLLLCFCRHCYCDCCWRHRAHDRSIPRPLHLSYLSVPLSTHSPVSTTLGVSRSWTPVQPAGISPAAPVAAVAAARLGARPRVIPRAERIRRSKEDWLPCRRSRNTASNGVGTRTVMGSETPAACAFCSVHRRRSAVAPAR